MPVNPGSARIRYLQIGGLVYDPELVYEIEVTESLMRPFQTLEMVMVDRTNILNRFADSLQGGEDVTLVFDNAQDTARVYEMKLKLHSIGSESQGDNLRSSSFRVTALGQTFYGNRVGGKVQQSFRNVAGSEAIRKIHDEYLRTNDASFIVDPSKGFIGEAEAYIVSNQTPFQAINSIRTRLTSDRYTSGAYCYYRDNKNYRLRQLEAMIAELEPQEVLIRDPTMGLSLSDYARQGRNILSFRSGTSFSGPGGRSAQMATHGVDRGVRSSYMNFGEGYNRGQQRDPTPATVIGQPRVSANTTTPTYTRQQKLFPGDPRLNQVDPIWEKSDSEQLYANMLRGGPSFTATTMMDGGLALTVGKGVYVDVPAATGYEPSTSDNELRGSYLVVNLKHRLHMYQTTPMATTIIEAVRGGYNA